MLRVKNMTSLFKKEILIYSIFDIKLQKPTRLVWAAYFLIVALFTTVPIFAIFPFNPITLCLGLGIPVLAAHFMSKPIWGGKSFFDFLKTQCSYLAAPKHYYDWNAGKKLEDYYIDSAIQVNRKNDYQRLFALVQKEEEAALRNG